MKKLLFLLIAFYSLAGFAQDKEVKTKDYWVYIKAQDEITTTKMIAGRSQKGDIVDAIPCSNSEGIPSTPGYFICKMALTAEQRAEMLEPYTEGEGETVETIAYRKNKIDLDTFKTANEIDIKTAVTTDKLSTPTLIEKTETDLSTLLQKAQHYERYQLPFIRVSQWFNNLFPQAKAADLVRYVNTASSGGDGTTNATSGDNAAYASLNLCEDAEDGDLTDNGGDTLTINCAGTSADTTTVFFDGWTTSSDYDITIIGNNDTGKWNTSAYRLEVDDNYAYILELSADIDYCTLSKLQVRNTNITSAGNVNYLGNGNSIFENCIFKGGSERYSCNLDGATGTVTLINCLIYDNGTAGIYADYPGVLTINAYNCVISGITGYGIRAYGSNCTLNAINCAVFNNNDDFSTSGTITINYCASDDKDGTNSVDISPNGTEADDWANAFTNYSSDFHIKDTDSVLYNAGTDLYSSGVTTDIDGDTLTVRNDIGADEYVSSGGSATPCVRPIMIMKVPRRYIKWMNG